MTVRTMTLVCEQHPSKGWPHGGCAGPGCPPEHRLQLFAEMLADYRAAAAFGDSYCAGWLDRHGIDHFPGDDA